MENRFNLIDEPWIAVVDVGLVSLTDIFSQPELRALNGNPVQKIALTKLLLAIAQSATTPADDSDWQQMGWQEWPIVACSTLLNGTTVFICMAKSRSYRCPLFRPPGASLSEHCLRR